MWVGGVVVLCVPHTHRLYSVWTLPPQLPGNSQVAPAHYKRSFLPPPSALALSLILLLLLSYSPLSPSCSTSLHSSLHMTMVSLDFSTLSLSLPFYNKYLKTMGCHLSLVSAVLEQWSRFPSN